MNPRIQQTPEKEKHKLNHIKASYNKTAKNQRQRKILKAARVGEKLGIEEQ